MNIQLDAQPDTTWAGDIAVTVSLIIIFFSAAVLSWYVFGAVRELVLSWA